MVHHIPQPLTTIASVRVRTAERLDCDSDDIHVQEELDPPRLVVGVDAETLDTSEDTIEGVEEYLQTRAPPAVNIDVGEIP